MNGERLALLATVKETQDPVKMWRSKGVGRGEGIGCRVEGRTRALHQVGHF